MMPKGHQFTAEQKKRNYLFQPGQSAWNTGTGGCKKDHDPQLYVTMPSGVGVCLGCKRENGAKYRDKNRESLRLKNRVRRYNLELQDLHRLYDQQQGKCAICSNSLDLKRSKIDHHHGTGKVRGLLCGACNTGIGCLQDSVEVLRAALVYLEKHHA